MPVENLQMQASTWCLLNATQRPKKEQSQVISDTRPISPRPVGTAVSVVSVTVSVASLPIRVDCLDYYCIVALLQDRIARASSQGTTHLCTKRHFTNNNYTRSASLRDVTSMVLLGPEGCSLLYRNSSQLPLPEINWLDNSN